MKKIAIASLSLFFLLALIGLALQTPWGSEKAILLLADALKKTGIEIEIGEIRGALPHQVEFKNLRIDTEGYEISVDALELRLSMLRLLKKEIAFTHVKGEGVAYRPKEGSPPVRREGIPYQINVEHFQLDNVLLPKNLAVNLEGALRIGKKNRYAFFDIAAARNEYPDSTLRLLLSIQRNGNAIGRLDLKTATLDALPFSHPIDGALAMEASLQGEWSSILQNKGPLAVRLKGTFHPRGGGPFFDRNWTFNGELQSHEDRAWTLSKFRAKSDEFSVKGNGELDPSGKLAQAQFEIQSDHLSIDSLSGRLFATVNLRGEGDALQGSGTWRIPVLSAGEYQVRDLRGSFEAKAQDSQIAGTLAASGESLGHKWDGSADASWARDSSLQIPSYRIHSAPVEIFGSLEVRQDKILVGTTEFKAAQLHTFSPSLYGNAEGKAVWFPTETDGRDVQGAHIDGKASDFYWNQFFAEEISCYSDLADLFHSIQGTAFIDMERARWGNLFLESASIETDGQGENGSFKLIGEGRWKHPLAIQVDGFWGWKKPELLISLQSGTGSFFNHPIVLAAPSNFEYSPEIFRLRDFTLKVGDATLAAAIDRDGEKTDAKISVDRLPLDFLSVNPLDVAISGLFNLDLSLKERGSSLQGELKSSIEQMEVLSLGQANPLNAAGRFEGTFERDRLDLKGNLEVRKAPLLNIDLSLPVHLEVWPFKADPLYQKEVKGRLALNGRLEDFLDFFDLGTHRLEGACASDLAFSGLLGKPLLSGGIKFEEGYYQNYYTGTELTNIRADWIAEGESLRLESLVAEDPQKKGTLQATGEIKLSLEEKCPFRFDVAFARLNCATFDLIATEAGGKIEIRGNWDEALANGRVEIVESDIAIPDRIPRQLPNLQVVYKNAVKPPEPPQSQSAPYPLHLDLTVDAPDGIFISGRGLNTEWKGNFHIGGEQTAIEAKGNIELIKGEFVFSGRRFKLSEGALSFSGIPNEMPFLNLAGRMDVRDVLITARLKGPLDNPQITLQSAPPLPMGTIMSYLLFGSDMSEINSFQALQLANSLSSLAGEGPDVLETTRRSLGVDRLRILNLPSQVEGGEDTIAVQVGKYVAEGVIVSYSQGADYTSGDISIEVEIDGGLSLQLESDQAHEQGKFTLRWSRNY